MTGVGGGTGRWQVIHSGWDQGKRSRGVVEGSNGTFLLGLCGQPRASQVYQQPSIQQPIAIVVAHCVEGGRHSLCGHGVPTPTRPCSTLTSHAIGPPVLSLKMCLPGCANHQVLHVPPCQEWAGGGEGVSWGQNWGARVVVGSPLSPTWPPEPERLCLQPVGQRPRCLYACRCTGGAGPW